VPAWLVQVWSDHQVAGIVRIRSPKFHDNVDAIRWRARSACSIRSCRGARATPLPQDVLSVELSGSAVAGDIESIVMQVYYPDLPGQAARLLDWAAVQGRMVNLVGQRIAMTIGSTAGYNGARAINADTDLLKANTDYALLGATTDVETAAITVRGRTRAIFRVAIPGETGLVHHVNNWFKRLSISTGLPLIPIINSANKGGTQVEVVGDENGGTANVTLWLAELKYDPHQSEEQGRARAKARRRARERAATSSAPGARRHGGARVSRGADARFRRASTPVAVAVLLQRRRSATRHDLFAD
jgi:hypothetical protein